MQKKAHAWREEGIPPRLKDQTYCLKFALNKYVNLVTKIWNRCGTYSTWPDCESETNREDVEI